MSSDLQTLISLLDQWIPPHTSDLVRRLNTDSIDLNDDENAIETRDQVTTHVEHEAEDPHSRYREITAIAQHQTNDCNCAVQCA